MDALARANAKLEGSKDILEPAVELGKGKFSQRFLEAIDKALCFAPEHRLQAIAEWPAMLPEWRDGARAPPLPVAPPFVACAPGRSTAKRPRRSAPTLPRTITSPTTAR